MSYEIREDRLVTRQGKAPDYDDTSHFAVVECDFGKLRVHLLPGSPEYGYLVVQDAVATELGFQIPELIAAIGDLSRLAGLEAPDIAARAEMGERAAQVVERVCAELESDHNPVRESLATDLRATMLQLIELAGRTAS